MAPGGATLAFPAQEIRARSTQIPNQWLRPSLTPVPRVTYTEVYICNVHTILGKNILASPTAGEYDSSTNYEPILDFS